VLLQSLYTQDWVVYAKRPLGGAEQVYSYLGRYTHRVGLSNHRIRDVSDQGVRFATKQGNTCTLTPVEFIRRFLLHVLPARMVKVRHYGLLAGSNVKTKLARARSLLAGSVSTPSAPSAPVEPVVIPPPAPVQPAVIPPPAPVQPVVTPPPAPPKAQAEALSQDLVAEVLNLTGQNLTLCPQCHRGPLRRIRLDASECRQQSGVHLNFSLAVEGTAPDTS
jgi:hypothetical protein